MAAFTDTNRDIILAHEILQARSKQDFATHGETIAGTAKYIVVCDGHGKSLIINYLRSVDWKTLLEDPKFIEKLMADIEKIERDNPYECGNGGSTLSVVLYTENSIHCYWVGDSSIKIFEDGKLVFVSDNHDRHNRAEVKRISETCNMRGIERENVWDIQLKCTNIF